MLKLFDLYEKKLASLAQDEEKRLRLQFIATYIILGTVALFMSAVNVFTGKTLLLAATLAFALLCGVNAFLAFHSEKTLKISTYIFRVEIIALFTFFLISGTPEGFSAIWAAMLPASGLLLFRRKHGSLLSGVMFLILVFLCWTAAGRSLLQYEYTQSFLLRFPMLYAAFFAMAFFLESVRQATFDNYIYLYTHDALTGCLNRKGFTEYAEELLKDCTDEPIGFMIADLDHFKTVNDTYGHSAGDAVLKEAAKRIRDAAGVPVCRWGGEEFAAIFLGGTGMTEEAGERIRRAFCDKPIKVGEIEIFQTISVGGANLGSTRLFMSDQLCNESDKCLYEAKQSGRNKVIIRDVNI